MNIDQLAFRTLPVLVEQAQAQLAGGLTTIDNKFDPQYLQNIFIQGRAALIKQAYTGNRGMAANHTIPSICIQNYYPTYDPDLQDDKCWNKFIVPEVIAFDDKFDGMRYVGSENDMNEFYRVRNASQYSTMIKDKMMKRLIDDRTVYIYTATDNILKLNDMDLRSGFKARCVFSNPLLIDEYDMLTDPFPLDISLCNMLISEIYNTFTRFESYTKTGSAAIGEDETQNPQLSRQLLNLMIKQSEGGRI